MKGNRTCCCRQPDFQDVGVPLIGIMRQAYCQQGYINWPPRNDCKTKGGEAETVPRSGQDAAGLYTPRQIDQTPDVGKVPQHDYLRMRLAAPELEAPGLRLESTVGLDWRLSMEGKHGVSWKLLCCVSTRIGQSAY